MSLFGKSKGLEVPPCLPRSLEKAADRLMDEMLTARLAPPPVLDMYNTLGDAAQILKERRQFNILPSAEKIETVRTAFDYVRRVRALEQHAGKEDHRS